MKIFARILSILILLVLLTACASTTPSSTNIPSTTIPEPTTMSAAVGIDAFNMRVAQYFMDTAGFHEIDEALNATKKIETTYPSTVNRVKKIVEQISWPEALAEPSHRLDKALNELSSSLEADNAADAAKAATTVHEAQHDLSHAIDEWAATQQPVAGDTFDIRVAQYLMDTAGFHEIDEALNETKKIETTYPSTVNRVKKIVRQISWPAALAEPSHTLDKALEELSSALEADNAADAAKAAATVHEAQHDLSHAIDEWAATQQPIAGDAFDVRVAQYLMDTAGFHEIDEALNATQKIEASYPSTVSRVKKVVVQLSWPAGLNPQVQAFVKALDQLSAALEADSAADAAKAASATHEAQHDLSHAIDESLGSHDAHDH